MASGIVKWFDNRRGFGFITQDSGPDIFVHHKDIVGNGFKTLYPGEIVAYELTPSEKGLRAERVERLPG
jgi:cold shock protein